MKHFYHLPNSVDYVVYVPKSYRNANSITLHTLLPSDIRHVAIVIEEQAEVTFLALAQDIQLIQVHLLLKRCSKLTYILTANKASVNATYSIRQEEQTSCQFLFTAINTDTFILDCSVELLGAHAQITMQGMHDNKEMQNISIKTEQIHKGAYTISSINIKGCVADQAQARYEGTVSIFKEALNANAIQNSKHLLLSSQAKAIAIPNLEIQTNEVQCKHGSAIGYFDKEQLFYFQTRGLSKYQSELLLKKAFFLDIMNHIGIADFNF